VLSCPPCVRSEDGRDWSSGKKHRERTAAAPLQPKAAREISCGPHESGRSPVDGYRERSRGTNRLRSRFGAFVPSQRILPGKYAFAKISAITQAWPCSFIGKKQSNC